MTPRQWAKAALIGVLVVAPITILPIVHLSRRPPAHPTADPASWRRYSPPIAEQERWEAELPGAPAVTTITTRSQGEAVNVTDVRVSATSGGFAIWSATLPDALLPGASPDQLLDAWDAMLGQDARPDARRVVARGVGAVDGHPARTVDLDLEVGPRQRLAARLWLVARGRVVFAFTVLRTPGDLANPDVSRFVGSVRLPPSR